MLYLLQTINKVHCRLIWRTKDAHPSTILSLIHAHPLHTPSKTTTNNHCMHCLLREKRGFFSMRQLHWQSVGNGIKIKSSYYNY